MTLQRVARAIRLGGRALAPLGAMLAIALAASANADPGGTGGQDAAFLEALQSAGITYTDPVQVVTAAHTLCGLVDGGESGLAVLSDLKAGNPGFSTDGAAEFAAIAARAYCPQQLQPAPG